MLVVGSKEKEVDRLARAKSLEKLSNYQAQLSSMITLRDSGMSTVTKDVKVNISKDQKHLDRHEHGNLFL